MGNGPGQVPDLIVRIWGMDANGRAFFQNAYARNVTPNGAMLSGVESPLKIGDIIGIQYNEKKARFTIQSARDAGLPLKIQADVRVLDGQECPWKDSMPQVSSSPDAGGGRNRRKFVRHNIRFPLELRDERLSGAHMQTNATDASGRGCYVETLVPLPLGAPVTVIFWLEEEKIVTAGIIRASDPGVGMGIEFMGLDTSIQDRLQKYLDSLDERRLGPKAPTP